MDAAAVPVGPLPLAPVVEELDVLCLERCDLALDELVEATDEVLEVVGEIGHVGLSSGNRWRGLQISSLSTALGRSAVSSSSSPESKSPERIAAHSSASSAKPSCS